MTANFYSQYKEDIIVSRYINSQYLGNILDIGANDGKTLSNSLHFIENGWGATLIEASPICFERLESLHSGNKNVQCLNYCLSDEDKKFTFYHNKTHYRNGDIDLLSTISKENYVGSRNAGNEFTSFEVNGYRFDSIKSGLMFKSYNIVSIDIEGYDLQILRQINLQKIDCKVLIIEYNDDHVVRNCIIEYCNQFDLKNILHDNRTNIIIVR